MVENAAGMAGEAAETGYVAGYTEEGPEKAGEETARGTWKSFGRGRAGMGLFVSTERDAPTRRCFGERHWEARGSSMQSSYQLTRRVSPATASPADSAELRPGEAGRSAFFRMEELAIAPASRNLPASHPAASPRPQRVWEREAPHAASLSSRPLVQLRLSSSPSQVSPAPGKDEKAERSEETAPVRSPLSPKAAILGQEGERQRTGGSMPKSVVRFRPAFFSFWTSRLHLHKTLAWASDKKAEIEMKRQTLLSAMESPLRDAGDFPGFDERNLRLSSTRVRAAVHTLSRRASIVPERATARSPRLQRGR